MSRGLAKRTRKSSQCLAAPGQDLTSRDAHVRRAAIVGVEDALEAGNAEHRVVDEQEKFAIARSAQDLID